MGSPLTNFTAQFQAQASGLNDVQRFAEAWRQADAAIDSASQRAAKINEHPGFSRFAESVKNGIENPLGAAASGAEAFITKLGPLGVGIAGVTGVATAAGTAVFELAKGLGEYGHTIEEASLRTGMTTKEVGQFSFAAKVAGQDLSVFETAMRKLSQGMDEQSKEGENVRAGLKRLGVEARDANGEIKGTSEVFQEIGEGLRNLPSAWERNTIAVQLFGRGGLTLVPMLMELNENLARAKELGFGPSEEQVQKFLTYHKAIEEVQARWERLKRTLAEKIVGVVEVIAQGPDLGVPVDANGRPVAAYNRRTRQVATGADLSVDLSQIGELPRVPTLAESQLAYSVAQGDLLLRRYRANVSSEERLKRLEAELGDLPKPVEGLSLESQQGRIDKIQQKEAEIAALKRQIEAVKEATEATKRFQKSLLDWDTERRRTLLQTWTSDVKGSIEEAPADGSYARAVAGGEAYFAQMAYAAAMAREREKTLLDRMISGNSASAGQRIRMLAAGAGPGEEVAALRASYDLRVSSLQKELEIKEAHASLYDIDEERWRIQQEMQAAAFEFEEAIAQRRRKGMQEARSLAVGGFQALVSRGGGFGSMLESQLVGQASDVVGNLAEMLYKPGRLSLPGTGTQEDPSWFGRMLSGTWFGPGQSKMDTAGDRLILAGGELQMAARALAWAGGGGVAGLGGFSPAASTFSRLFGGGAVSAADLAGGSMGDRIWAMDEAGNLIPGGWKSTSGGSSGFTAMKGVGYAAGALAAGYGIYSGVSMGGARGAMTGLASALGGAAMIPGPQEPFLAAGALIAGFVTTLFGDPKAKDAQRVADELNAARYTAPAATTYTMDRSGRGFDYNTRGEIRVVLETPIQVNTLSGRGVVEAIPEIAEGLAAKLEDKTSRLNSAIRAAVYLR